MRIPPPHARFRRRTIRPNLTSRRSPVQRRARDYGREASGLVASDGETRALSQRQMTSTFRYLTGEVFAQAFLKRGAVMLRPPSYYRAIEDDDVLGNAADGVLACRLASGLGITKENGTKLLLANTSFSSQLCVVISSLCGSIGAPTNAREAVLFWN